MKKAHTEKLIYILPLVILTSFVMAYWPVFQKIEKQWSAGDNSYCYLIVPLFLYLCYDKKGHFRFGEFSWSLWGLIPIVLSVLLIVIGELGSVRALMFMGIWGCAVGSAVMLYGKRTRFLLFPLIVLFFIVPLPPFVNQILTFKLKMAASKLSVIMLRAVGVSVLLEGNIIDIGVDKLQVVDACSGLRYFMPMILMAILVAYFFVKGRWRWTVLLLMIVPLSIFINALRIWMSALFVVNGHPELAHNLFHDFSGWLMFMIAGVILVAVALVLKRLSKEQRGKRREEREEGEGRRTKEDGREKMDESHDYGLRSKEQGLEIRGQMSEVGDQWEGQGTKEDGREKMDESPRRSVVPHPSEAVILPPSVSIKPDPNQLGGWFKPTLITVILCLLFAGSGWALKQIPSSNNLPRRMSFEQFPMKIGDWQGKREYISQEILNGLWADDYVTARYFKDGSPNMMYLLIPFYNYQITNHTAHAPQACILGGGFSLVKSKTHLIRVSPGREIKIMTMILTKGDTRLLGSYFFLQKGRVITSPWMNKFYLIWDGITKQRTDGALVRAEMTVASGKSMEEAYDELEEFITKLWPILPDYIPG